MRVVADTNSLETDELRIFLEASTSNLVVLPEHTSAELFKPSSLDAVYAAHRVLCDFPSQIRVLHANRQVVRIDARAPAIANRFIDRATSRKFPQFCLMLRAAEGGNLSFQRQLKERQQWANERALLIENAIGDQADSLAELRSQFSAEDLRRLAAGEPLSRRMRISILSITDALAFKVAAAQPGRLIVPPPPQRYNHFAWRYALCHVVQLMQLVRNGAVRRAPAKARNDHFDNVFATFGTYFNGVITNDNGTLVTQNIARIILRALLVRLAPDYVESGYIIDVLKKLMAEEGAPNDGAIAGGSPVGFR